MTMKRIPSFSSRPDFPNNLQVLLVEADEETRAEIERQLEECSYVATSVSGCFEATSKLKEGCNQFDIVLAEARLVRNDADTTKAFLEAGKSLPLVLMGEGGKMGDVWKGIELGAVDFLEKPLSLLKLRNIWQHVVRKMMSSMELEDRNAEKLCTGTQDSSQPKGERQGTDLCGPSTPSATDSGPEGAGSVSFAKSSKGSEGESALRTEADASTDDSQEQQASKLGAEDKSKVVLKASRKDKPGQVTHRPPLAIRPPAWAPVPMLQPAGWGHVGPCVWGTPLGGPSQAPPPTYPTASQSQGPPHHPGWPPQASVPFVGAVPMGFPVGMHHPSPPCMQRSTSVPLVGGVPAWDASSAAPAAAGLEHSQSLDVTLDLLGPLSDEKQRDLPIGLSLKKSPSLLDLINETLAAAGASAAVTM